MESVCLESLWQNKLENAGWSQRAKEQFSLSWANSTLTLYNRLLRKCELFCLDHNCTFPPSDTSILADFLCNLCDSSEKPRSMLNSASAALTCAYNSMGITSLMHSPEIQRLLVALIKSGTKIPMCRSKLMPVDKFRMLFSRWPENSDLTERQLRLKSLTLLALVTMLRPSDVAPKSVIYDADAGVVKSNIFSMDNVCFNLDGSMCVTFFGIKNDTTRSGFKVQVQPHKDSKLDPVKALQDYIHISMPHRPKDTCPVFVTLKPPFKQIDSCTVARVLEESIELAGLKDMGFNAKSFRPTAATVGVDNDIDPNVVMQIGRWKTREVFYDHYVHSKVPRNFSSTLLDAKVSDDSTS